MTKTARWTAYLCVTFAAVFALPLAPARADGVQIGAPAPRIDIRLVSGSSVTPRQLEGRVVLQYFWATWCPICRGDLPRLQALHDAHGRRGLVIIAQSLDDDPEAVTAYWREHGYTFPVAMRSDETREGFGPIVGTPTLFLIDRAGVVRHKRLGRFPDGMLEAQIAALLEAPKQGGLR